MKAEMKKAARPPFSLKMSRTSVRSGAVDLTAPATPDIDGEEEEEPDDVHEMPVPGGGFEAEMLVRREVPRTARRRQTARKITPTKTWNPWKPVAMKKVAP